MQVVVNTLENAELKVMQVKPRAKSTVAGNENSSSFQGVCPKAFA